MTYKRTSYLEIMAVSKLHRKNRLSNLSRFVKLDDLLAYFLHHRLLTCLYASPLNHAGIHRFHAPRRVWAAIHSAQSRVHTMTRIQAQRKWLSLSREFLVWPNFSPIYLFVNNMKIDQRTMTQEAKNPLRQCALTAIELLKPSEVSINWLSMC